MSTTHTPGPWTLVPLDAPKSLHMISAKVGDRNPLVCSVEHSRSGSIAHDQAGHNARLIVAAPELLAMLQEIEADTAQSLDAMKDDGITPPAWFVEQHQKIKGVIARAVSGDIQEGA